MKFNQEGCVRRNAPPPWDIEVRHQSVNQDDFLPSQKTFKLDGSFRDCQMSAVHS